ncbi:MAG: extracellular solute-binding protein [Actinomycetes bacterium]
MKKSMRRTAFAASIVLAATGVVGVSLPIAHAADVNLTMVAADYPGDGKTQQAQWDAVSKAFAAANPGITMTVNVVSWDVIDDKVKTLIATGKTPDIVNKGDYSAPAAAGLLYKASEMVSASTLADIIPTFLNNSMYNGTAYAVPDLASARALFYNKAILKKAGVTKLPTTWKELLTVLSKIKAKNPGVYGYAVPMGPEEAQAEFSIWAGGNGGRLYDYTAKKWTVNSAANIEAMAFLKKMNDLKYIEPNPAKCDRTACAQTLFAAGKAAFINGSVFLPGWLKDNGGAGIDLGSGSFVHNDGQEAVTLGVQDYFTAYKANGHQAEIQKFMDFLYKPANYAAFLKAAGGFIPATKSAGVEAAKDPALAPFIALLPHAIFYPGDIATWPAVKGALQQSVGLAVTGNPSKVLGDIQKKANAAK